MPEPLSPEAAEAEFDMLTARAGVPVPAERRAELIAAFRDFRVQLDQLHAPRPHTAELSNIFSLVPQGGAR